MTQPRLRVERDGPIGLLVLDNPARRNAIAAQMWRDLPQAVAAFIDDPAIRCIVVRGEGGEAFAAGADISEFEARRSSSEDVKTYEAQIDAAHRALDTAPKPVIALIHGFCVGGGLAVALSCDLRYAGESARFAIPAARLGLAYGIPGLGKLVATVGHGAAREIMFTARRYDAQEALAMGLVHRVVPDALLEQHVREVAETLAANAPLTIAAAKTAINALIAPQGDFAASRAAIEACMQSADYAEGRRAFMEKRKPRFTGS
jgi:enoyl-CoA hydratase/carnithine racemase